MADFSDLPKGIPRKLVVDHLDDLEDIESFQKVCSLWRSESMDVNYKNFCPYKNTQLPWLMLADSPTSSYRRVYSLSKRMFLKIDVPHLDTDADDDHRRYFSSKGWLIGVSRNQGLMTFYDPFSSTVIHPPSIPLLKFMDGNVWNERSYLFQFSKFVFSTSGRPSSSSSSCDGGDFQVAIIWNMFKNIAFWRPGQQQWIEPKLDFEVRQVNDVCYFRGEFYSIDHYSQVIAFGSEVGKRPPRVVANLKKQVPITEPCMMMYIAVSNEDTLLIVHREVFEGELNTDDYWTMSFQLIEVNVDDGKAKLVDNIGNRAVFVGFNSTFFVDASPHGQRGCKPNCIYFTDDNEELYHKSNKGGSDMGIFSLEEGRVIQRIYQGPSQFDYITPPIWVELPHH